MAGMDKGSPEEPGPAAPAIGQPRSVSRFILVRLPYIICGVLLLAAIAINFANVVGRYIFSAPVAWAEEILIYIIVWGVFISVGSITYQGLHLRMDLLVIRISGWAKTFLGVLTATLIIVCSVFVAVQTTRILRLYIGSGETSMGAKIPLFIPHSALLVGFVMMAIAAAIRFRNYATGKFD
jgi:TRAP-type transport system small permease protein